MMLTQRRYESSVDRAVQDVVYEFLRLRVRTIGGQVVELSQTVVGATVDYIWRSNGSICAAGELKRRNISHDAFATLMISATKISELQRMADVGYIFVLYTDGLYHKRIQRGEAYPIARGGRTTHSRDLVDAAGEDCVYFPIKDIAPMTGWSDWWTARAWDAAVGGQKS